MKITVNNRAEEINRNEMTISELILYKRYTFKLLVTKLNGKLVKKDERDKTVIHNGDDVAIIHMVSGG